MRLKHNKKRNTAFLYEVLIKQYAVASLKKDGVLAESIKNTLKEFFAHGKPLSSELKLYKNLYELNSIDSYVAHRLIQESKQDFNKLDKRTIFNEQTRLINWINKNVGRDSFNMFVPNYKTLATISQIFNQGHNAKERVLLEKKLVVSLMRPPAQQKKEVMKPMNDLVYRTVIKNFNNKYDEQLQEEQKKLIQKYVLSFSDGGFGFVSFLNEEIGRIKTIVEDHKTEDQNIKEKLNSVVELIESFKKEPLNDTVLEKVLKLQSLVKELDENGDND
jgi:hypothetical protein